MEFTFILKDNSQRSFRVFFWFLFFLHLIVAGVTAINAVNKNIITVSYITIALLVISGLVLYLAKLKSHLENKFRLLIYLLFINQWWILSNYMAMVICIAVITFALFVRKRKIMVLVNADKVTLKGILSEKKYSWQQIENIILKDGLLTIDCTDNHLMQLYVDEELTNVDQIEFNTFCSKQLS